MRSREVLMCSDRYADDISFLLPKTQLPPIRSDFSNTSNSRSASWSFLAAAIPEEPAPTTHAVGSFGRGFRTIRTALPSRDEVDSGVSFALADGCVKLRGESGRGS